jgi:photosystem II stability/assembly factor-like uncharacterized protein
MKIFSFIILLVLLNSFSSPAQRIMLIARNDSSSLRGLSVVSDQVIWVSGSRGTVGKSLDGGKTWKWITVRNYESRDFRDIEAFDKQEAIIMAVAEPAIILKTRDGGNTWYKVYEDSAKGMFLDAMDFSDHKKGIVVGDPINGKFFLHFTEDGGETWHGLPGSSPASQEGEACFAASGTNILLGPGGSYSLVSGGKRSRFIRAAQGTLLPLQQGSESTGANSVATWEGKKYIVLGGDFAHDHDSTGNCAISVDGGKSWKKPEVPPHGYRSCAAWTGSSQIICCGTSGVDISIDGGIHWTLLSRESYNVCARAKTGTSIILAGSKGRIARLIPDQKISYYTAGKVSPGEPSPPILSRSFPFLAACLRM